MNTPFYDLVPKGLKENLEWRIRCRERALVDEQFRNALIQACENDVLFFFAFALWVEEPRERIKLRPFVPWPHQESVIVGMDDTITEGMTHGHPVSATVKKSRAQGGTYTYLGVQIRRALFEDGFSSGLVSRNEKMMDSKDPSAVMNKLSSMLDKLPVWMLDKYDRNITDHTIKIPKTNSIWVGYSATADVARGGRTSMFAFDEVGSEEFIAGGVDFKIMSSVAHVTNCVFLCSTFGADAGVFYESATDPDNPRVYSLDWKDNPVHSKLAYIRQNGIARAVRPEDQEAVDEYIKNHARELRSIERRGHVIDGKFRSPWYDSHCVAGGTLVVTDRGLVPIENVLLEDRVWDGNMWVSHDGCVFKGCKKTIRSYRVGLTPDHRVFTVKGWKHAIEGFDRAEIRLPDGYREKWSSRELCGLALQVPMRSRKDDFKQSFDARKNCELWLHSIYEPALQNSNIQLLGCDDSALHQHKASKVCIIRDAWYQSMRAVDEVRQFSTGHGLVPKRINPRSHRQRRKLRAWKLSLGHSGATTEQPQEYNACQNTNRNGTDSRVGTQGWNDNQGNTKPHQERLDGGCSFASTKNSEPVYDLLNCGPRRAFTVIDDDGRPLLVHNCLLPGATPRFIARELDMDAKGAASKCFQPALLERMKKEHCKRPVWQGVPVIDKERPEVMGLSPRDDGPLRLWFRPGIDFSPPLGPYTAGCDVASGGMSAVATPSVITMIDNSSGEQVLEYAIKGVEPRAFAFTVVALCMWMRKALLGWEDAGNSGGFADEIAKLNYWNVFYRTSEQFGSQTKTRRVGWPVRRDSDKADLFDRLSMAMDAGLFIPRSEEMVTECGEYEWDGDKLVHVPTKNKGAGNKNHADRAISAAGCWYVFSTEHSDGKVDSSDENGQTVEYGSFLWRERRERRGVDPGSPQYGLRDVLRGP